MGGTKTYPAGHPAEARRPLTDRYTNYTVSHEVRGGEVVEVRSFELAVLEAIAKAYGWEQG